MDPDGSIYIAPEDQSLTVIAHEILVKARSLIDTPDKWTQRELHNGNRRCATAAIVSANPGPATEPTIQAMRHLADAMGSLTGLAYASVFKFNDTHTHAEVMVAFDRAIEATEPRERI